MKTTLLFLCFASVSIGGEILEWPPDTKYQWETISVAKLPSGVEPQDPEDPERALSTVRVRKVDVDGDGISDLIVDTGRGGSGGSYMVIYRREGKRYRAVLSEQGAIVVRPAERGVARIECWGRIGGGEYRRTVYRFSRGRFVEEFRQTLKHRDDDKLEVTETRKANAK